VLEELQCLEWCTDCESHAGRYTTRCWSSARISVLRRVQRCAWKDKNSDKHFVETTVDDDVIDQRSKSIGRSS
jgi:hypothetical protein